MASLTTDTSYDGQWKCIWDNGASASLKVVGGAWDVYQLTHPANQPVTFNWPDGTVQTLVSDTSPGGTRTVVWDAKGSKIVWEQTAIDSAAATKVADAVDLPVDLPVVPPPAVDHNGLLVRGAPPRQPWQTWQTPDDANEHGHRYGYVADPATGESHRLLLAKRIAPSCCYLRVLSLFVTCWMVLLGSIGLSMVVMQVLIHLPVWTFALPQFMFHSPATFLFVVFVGMKSTQSMHANLNPEETVEEPAAVPAAEVPAEIAVETEPETKEDTPEEMAGTSEFVAISAKEGYSVKDVPFLMQKIISICYVALLIWAIAVPLLGAAVFKLSLRLQQMHAMPGDTGFNCANNVNMHLQRLPESFLPTISTIYNIRFILSGWWLLDMYFCLTASGLALMSKWSHMLIEETLAQKTAESMKHGFKKLNFHIGMQGLTIGFCSMLVLAFLEWDRLSLYPGFKIVCVAYAIVAWCVGYCIFALYGYKESFFRTLAAFHDQLRDTKYRSGLKLRKRERTQRSTTH